jgi:hypothetical protein
MARIPASLTPRKNQRERDANGPLHPKEQWRLMRVAELAIELAEVGAELVA